LLPGINGAELLRALRDRGESVVAVVISAYTDDRTMNEASRVGAAFIAKPLDFVLLSRIVREGTS
jgi:FixJ family two-component response regulator